MNDATKNNNQNPLVSVIIPVYNRREFLVRAIKSVLNQSYSDFEILVIDDCSSENIQEIVLSFHNDRIVYVRHEKNSGANVARNTGIAYARGEFVAFLDSDDEWLPEKLKDQMEIFAQADEKVGIVYSGYWIMQNSKKFLGHIPEKRGDIFQDELVRDYVSPTSCVMVRKSCLEKAGRFDIDMLARQDYEMWLRLSREFYFEYIKQPLSVIYFDKDPRRISLSGIDKQISAEEMILEKYKDNIHALSTKTQKEIYGRHYLVLGKRCWYNGSAKHARRFFVRALKIKPTALRYWFYFFISFFGNNFYGRIALAGKELRTLAYSIFFRHK